ncbi:MAG: MmcQ/YjbR family DNA-binding protein [Vicingaceae bacterium]
MNIEEFREYCLNKRGVTEEFPFDLNTLVYKTYDKIFAITDVDAFQSVNLKCDPDKAVELRELYDFVKPGYHMNKKHWNTVEIVWELSDDLLKSWIDHSYDLVFASLPKKIKNNLNL